MYIILVFVKLKKIHINQSVFIIHGKVFVEIIEKENRSNSKGVTFRELVLYHI